jgi:hypothetical protein
MTRATREDAYYRKVRQVIKKRGRKKYKRIADRDRRETSIYSYGSHLRGFSHTQLTRQKGLDGATFGPASDCRRIDPKTGEIIEVIKAKE